MKFSIKIFFSICGQIRRKLRIWSHLLRKSFMKNFTFCAVYDTAFYQKLLTAKRLLTFFLKKDLSYSFDRVLNLRLKSWCLTNMTNWQIFHPIRLTHFQPMLHFYTPWKNQKTGGFLFSGGVKLEHWLKMG